jgi:uncharacterized repeat protein (TIGR01451 family)
MVRVKNLAAVVVVVCGLVAGLVVAAPVVPVAGAQASPVVLVPPGSPGGRLAVRFVAETGSLILQSGQPEELDVALEGCPGGVPVDPDTPCIEFTGTVGPNGDIVIPASGVSFPAIPFEVAPGETINVRILPTHDATGTIDPRTGASTLRVRLRIQLTGSASGVDLGNSCFIGSPTQPLDMQFTTGTSGIAGSSVGFVDGVPYNEDTGQVTMANATFGVIGAQGCGPLSLGNGPVNDALGLPAPAGRNMASFQLLAFPRIEWPRVDVGVAKSSEGDMVVGDVTDFFIDVTSRGTLPTSGAITVLDTLPAGLTYEGFAGQGWSCSADGQVVSCIYGATVGRMPVTAPTVPRQPLAVPRLTISAVVDEAAVPFVDNTVTVSTPGDAVAENNTATFRAFAVAPNLAVTKSHVGDFFIGRPGVFEVAVNNVGTAPTVGDITLVDTLPAGLEFVSVDAPAGFDCGMEVVEDAETVTCVSSAVWAPGDGGVFRITVMVDEAAIPSATNTVTVSTPTDPVPENDTDSDTVTITFLIGNAGPFSATVTEGWLDAGSRRVHLPSCPLGQPPVASSAACGSIGGEAFPDGSLSIPASGLDFPAVEFNTPQGRVPARFVATGDGSGVLDPTTGEMTVEVPVRLSAPYGPDCGSGPFTLSLSTAGVIEPVIGVPVEGKPYNSRLGTARLVAEPFELPAVSNCVLSGVNYNSFLNGVFSLPDAENLAVVDLRFVNILQAPGAPVGPDVAVALTPGGFWKVGHQAHLTAAVTNVGPAPTSGPVNFSSTLPAGVVPTAAAGPGWTCSVSGQLVSCVRAAALATGFSAPLVISVDVVGAGDTIVVLPAQVNTAGDLGAANNTTSLQQAISPADPIMDVAITKVAGDPVIAGQNGSFELRVRNVGDLTTVGDIVVSDTLPDNTSLINVGGPGWSCAGTVALTCSHPGPLAPGANLPVITLAVTTSNDSVPRITNTASVAATGDVNGLNNSSTDSLRVSRPASGGVVANPGEVTIEVTGGLISLSNGAQEVPLGGDATEAPSITGIIDADGALTVPAENVNFPSLSVGPPEVPLPLNINIYATAPATGIIDPVDEVAALELGLNVDVEIIGFGTCTLVVPISASGDYDPTSGTGVITDATFAVPGATCTEPELVGLINTLLSLPAGPGTNSARLEFRTVPIIEPGDGDGDLIANPGPVTIRLESGLISLADGAQEVPIGSDDPEAVLPTINGVVDPDGNLTIPAENVDFPELSIGPPDVPIAINVAIVADGPASGFIDPFEGVAGLSLALNVNLDIGPGTAICTLSVPLNADGTYSSETGTGTLTDDTYAVPASSCDETVMEPVIDGLLGLPSGSGRNLAVLNYQIDPIILPGTASGPRPPGAPRNPAAANRDSAVRVSWQPPLQRAGSVTGYRVVATPGGRSCTTGPNGRDCVVRGLTNGVNYTFSVVAQSTAGDSPAVTVTGRPRTVPTAPRNLATTTQNSRLRLDFTRPASNGGAPITQYQGRCAPDHPTLPTRSATTTDNTTRVIVTNLTNGVRYDCQVRARNQAGWGPWTTPVTGRPAAPPGPPRNLTAAPRNQAARLTWTRPANNGGAPITSYRARCRSGAAPNRAANTTTTAITIGGLRNGITYRCQVRAINAAGAGPWTTNVTVTPRA